MKLGLFAVVLMEVFYQKITYTENAFPLKFQKMTGILGKLKEKFQIFIYCLGFIQSLDKGVWSLLDQCLPQEPLVILVQENK